MNFWEHSASGAQRNPATGDDCHDFRSFLKRSLRLLWEQHPPSYQQMALALAGKRVLIEIDHEAIALRFADGTVYTEDPHGHFDVEARTSKAVILGLVDGQHTLMSTVLEDLFFLRGAMPELLAFHEGLTFYLQGAVRAPSFPGLLRRFRALEPSQTTPTTHTQVR